MTPQSETWQRAQRIPPRPTRVSGWLAGLGILLMIVAALGTGVALAVSAMQVSPK